MKKRVISMFLALMICVTGVWGGSIKVKAEEMGEDLDFSYLLTEETLVGYMELQTRGVYLAEGNSFINKMSSTKIGAGAVTNAALKCKVSATAIVERKNDSGSWERVTSWTNTVTSGYTAGVSKSLTVGTGYYYRVRGLHYAASDGSTSGTDALWMGN